MARTKRRSNATPAGRARRFSDNGTLQSPLMETVDWGTAPQVAKIPSNAEFKEMSDVDLSRWLKRWGVTDAWPAMRASAAGYLQRVSALPPGSPEFDARLDDLVSGSSRRFLLGANRRVLRDYGMLEITQGVDLATQEYIRISEGDEDVCDRCDSLGGHIGTMAEQDAAGLPGAASCYGGDYCRCELVLID